MSAQAIVSLDAIGANIDVVRGRCPAQVMLVVKADAYGHGAVPVSRFARGFGIEWLGVAMPSEALALRRSGDRGRLLAWLYAPTDSDLADCVDQDIDLSVSSIEMLDAVVASSSSRARIHLKVDTGLGRNGCPPSQWPELVSRAGTLQRSGRIDVVGVWSHLANGEIADDTSTKAQRAAFDDAIAMARALDPEVIHIANSGAALSAPEVAHDLVRIGIAAYGLDPGGGLARAAGLRPAMTLRVPVALVKRLPAGHGVSYGVTWRAPRETRVALLPVGYADGIPRAASGLGEVAIGGTRAPVRGRVAMDQVVVDVGDRDVRAGDDAIVFGAGDTGEPTADEWASWCNTIGYEIVTRIGPRVRRVHVGDA